jgi:hypothetical protein
MDQELFKQKLSEVSEWIMDKHQGHSYEMQGRGVETDLSVPTYPRILKLKDIQCPYNDQHKNCDIQIKIERDPFGDKFYYQRCKSCRGVIVNGQWHDTKQVVNVTNFALRLHLDNK